MDKFVRIPNAQHRSLSFQERFSFLLFIGKFILSKFGLVLVFLLIHISSRYSQNSFLIGGKEWREKKWVEGSSKAWQFKERDLFPCRRADSKLSPSASPHERGFPALTPNDKVENLIDGKTLSDSFVNFHIFNEEVFQKIRNYCIIGTIVTLFLNPQQTKYFGGLAVVLKQAGFFTKYSKSEKTVYVFSWIFVILFFSFSVQVAALTRVPGGGTGGMGFWIR